MENNSNPIKHSIGHVYPTLDTENTIGHDRKNNRQIDNLSGILEDDLRSSVHDIKSDTQNNNNNSSDTTNPSGDMSLLSDIDDEEIQEYILTEEEVKFKTGKCFQHETH